MSSGSTGPLILRHDAGTPSITLGVAEDEKGASYSALGSTDDDYILLGSFAVRHTPSYLQIGMGVRGRMSRPRMIIVI